MTHVAIDHPRFKRVDPTIFTARLAPDCMAHQCKHHEQTKLDACCQYGCDVDLKEKDAILARAAQIRPLLKPDVQDRAWFEEEVYYDNDYPSGAVVRTQVVNDGCLFLQHDLRGCAIHRASIEQGWDFRGTKPAICRLFPLSYEHDEIMIAEEYPEYSCAHVEGPSLYRITRDIFAELFGDELVVALDAAEAQVLARRLPVL